MGPGAKVVTVTINPAIDQTLIIPHFTAGAVNRVQASEVHAGGKGINVASFLADFGRSAVVTGLLGEENDGIFRRLFEQKGIEDRCVRVAGATRTGLKISDFALGQTTDINFPGSAPASADLERLLIILSELAVDHEWFVLSGSTPAGVSPALYGEMVKLLAGKRVVVDTSGEGLRHAVEAGPWLIKPNVEELSEFVGEKLATGEHLAYAARSLLARYGMGCVVVSMGEAGAIYVEDDAALWAIPGPVQVKSTVGAGDALVAGTVAGKMQGLPLAECARLGTAFAMAAIGRIGHSLPPVEEVEAAKQRVTIRRLA